MHLWQALLNKPARIALTTARRELIPATTPTPPTAMARFILTLAAVVLAANAIAGSCYVRKACLALTHTPALCDYKV